MGRLENGQIINYKLIDVLLMESVNYPEWRKIHNIGLEESSYEVIRCHVISRDSQYKAIFVHLKLDIQLFHSWILT